MKPMTWQLITCVVCIWLAAIQCISGRGLAGIYSLGLPHVQHLLRGGRRFASNQRLPLTVHYPEISVRNACLTKPLAPPHSLLADLVPDREEPAGDGQSDVMDSELVCLEPCLRAAERQLAQPDAPGFDSFINTTTRPPP